jgi:hypothetical protein
MADQISITSGPIRVSAAGKQDLLLRCTPRGAARCSLIGTRASPPWRGRPRPATRAEPKRESPGDRGGLDPLLGVLRIEIRADLGVGVRAVALPGKPPLDATGHGLDQAKDVLGGGRRQAVEA